MSKGVSKNFHRSQDRCLSGLIFYLALTIKLSFSGKNLNEFYYDCGTCPVNNEFFKNTSNVSLSKRLSGINLDGIQCAECNNGPLCNNEKFLEKQMFCWEKSENETKMIKGARVCRDKCFVSRNFTTGNGRELIFTFILTYNIHSI